MAAVTEVAVDGVAGFTTYRLHVNIPASAANVYVIAGTPDSPLHMPAAYQCALPFGKHLGGVSPLMFAVANSDASGFAEFDSWLTIGITEGDTAGMLSSTGIDFDSWTESDGLATSDGLVFWMSPDNGWAAFEGDAVLAQITVAEGSSGTVSMGIQGRSTSGPDWSSDNIEFAYP